MLDSLLMYSKWLRATLNEREQHQMNQDSPSHVKAFALSSHMNYKENHSVRTRFLHEIRRKIESFALSSYMNYKENQNIPT